MLPQTHYQRIGGETKVRELVERFYDHMDELSGSRQKLFDFLTGWMGGPPLYTDKHGHPMLRRRHLPFGIGESERDQWMHCMQLALAEVVGDEQLRAELYKAFMKVADHMRNKAG